MDENNKVHEALEAVRVASHNAYQAYNDRNNARSELRSAKRKLKDAQSSLTNLTNYWESVHKIYIDAVENAAKVIADQAVTVLETE